MDPVLAVHRLLAARRAACQTASRTGERLGGGFRWRGGRQGGRTPAVEKAVGFSSTLLPLSRDQTSSKRCVATGKQRVSGSQHVRPMGLPRNPMECDTNFIE